MREGNGSICLVIPSLQAGGMERVMSELAHHFVSKQTYKIHLVLYGITREIFYPLPDGIIVHKPAFKFDNKYRFFFTLRTMLFLRQTIKKLSPLTVLSFGEYWNNFVLLSSLGLKYPVYVSERSQPDKSLGRVHDFLRKRLYRNATGIILQTEKAREIFLNRQVHNNISVIGNPIREIKMVGKDDKKEKIVLMVGRLIKSKHQDHLIEIFARINPPGWKLMLVGYDHLKQRNQDSLKELAVKLGIGEKVIFTGKQDDVESVYLKSSIFAFTSSSEGFPNVIGEAMQAGLPVVAYDCVAGPSEMIDDGYNGYLVPLFDKAVFGRKLSLLIESRQFREQLGQNAKVSIKRFSKDQICDRFYDFILEGVSHKSQKIHDVNA